MPSVPPPGVTGNPAARAKKLKQADSSPERKGVAGGARFSDVGAGWKSFTSALGRDLPTALLRAGRYDRAARVNLAARGRKR